MRRHIAHIRQSDGTEQFASEHCQAVSALAAEYLASLRLAYTGRLAGLLHDMGKCTEAFDTYIRKSHAGEPVIRGSVNHTFAGVIYLFENFYTTDDVYAKLTCELTAYAVGAHHGLFDCLDEAAKIGFDHRIRKDRAEIFYEEAKENFLQECADEEEIKEYFYKAVSEIENLLGNLDTDKPEGSYILGLLARIILSALADADRSDTAAFEAGTEVEKLPADINKIWEKQLRALEANLRMKRDTAPINQTRAVF